MCAHVCTRALAEDVQCVTELLDKFSDPAEPPGGRKGLGTASFLLPLLQPGPVPQSTVPNTFFSHALQGTGAPGAVLPF